MYQYLLPTLLVGVFAAFSEDGCSVETGNKGNARLTVAITDAPVDDVERVQLTITGITLGTDKLTIKVPLKKDVVIDDLLRYQGRQSFQLVGDEKVQGGEFQWLRLHISERDRASFVLGTDGKEYPLNLGEEQPPAQGRYLEVRAPVRLVKDKLTDVVVDLDLSQSLIRDNSGRNPRYQLLPRLRLAERESSGHIVGTIHSSHLQGRCSPDANRPDAGNRVYLYQGENAYPSDIFLGLNGVPSANDTPFATARATRNSQGEYSYELGHIPAGGYTVAFTCQGLADLPTQRDPLHFTHSASVTVKRGESTRFNFPDLDR